MPIKSMDDLPPEVQKKESSTFDFSKIKQLLQEAYYRGPAVNDDNSRTGLRRSALRGDPSSHRKSILRKAEETGLVKKTPEGYATTEKGLDILNRMTICEDCDSDEEPYMAVVRTGKYSGYTSIFLKCPHCNDPGSINNVHEHVREDEDLIQAVRVMESCGVVCYLNGKSIEEIEKELNL